MNAEIVELVASLCAAVLGVQMAAIAVVWVMDFIDAARGRNGGVF